MQPIALTRASQLIHVTDTLERLGFSAERMLEQAKLPLWHYCDPDDLIPGHHVHALLHQAARNLGSSSFGLLVGADNSVNTLGTFGRLVMSSPTIHQAFVTACRLIHLHNTGSHLSLAEVGDAVWFGHSEFPSPKIGRRQKELYVLMRLIEYGRMAAGPSWRPAKVCLQTHEPPEPELREALGDPEIRIGQMITGIAMPRSLLAQPMRRSGATGEAIEEIEGQLRHAAPASGFVGTLRQLTGTLLKQEGVPRIETMAEITGLSVRSLQRRLAKHGLSHFEIVDQARYQAATRLLGDADTRITDVAMDLGYADSAHFTRAFKRWAGVTPREYRHHQLMQ